MIINYYLKNYKFLVIYFLFFFIPKIKLGNDIYIWPFEPFMILFILYFLFIGGEIVLDKVLLYPIIFFVYLLILSFFHISLQNYSFSLGEFLRNIKMLLYFVFQLFMFSYLFKKYRDRNIIFDILKLYVFFASLIMVVMLAQIFYFFIKNGIPSPLEIIWNVNSNYKPYLYQGRYITNEGLKDIEKGNLNSTGILSVLVFFISGYLLKKNHSKFFFISKIISLVTLLLSFSRSSFVVFILMLFFYIFTLDKTINKLKSLLYIILVVSTLLLFFQDILNYTIFSKIQLTIESSQNNDLEVSSATRVGMWEYFFSGKPNYFNLLLGNGFGSSGVLYFTNNRYSQLESLFLNNLVWAGVISFLFLYYYYIIIKRAKYLKLYNTDLFKIFFFFFIFYLLPNTFTGGDFLIDSSLHYLFPIIFIIFYNYKWIKNENFVINC